MARAAIFLSLWFFLFQGIAGPARAESIDAFLSRVRQAYAAPDKAAALRQLHYLEGMDAETVAMYDARIIGRMLGKYETVARGGASA